jgi:hypothetical protein
MRVRDLVPNPLGIPRKGQEAQYWAMNGNLFAVP